MKLFKLWDWLFPIHFYQTNVAAAVVGTVAGGYLASQAAGDAGDAQVEASDRATAEQRRQYDQTRTDNMPFREAGLSANKNLLYRMGLSPDGGLAGSATNDPAYGSLMRKFSQEDLDNDVVNKNALGFALEEGKKGLARQSAASGSMLSGATEKALAKYTTGLMTQYGNDARNRFVSDQDSVYNKLAGMSGAGQTATAQITAAGQNMANNVSENMLAAGNARAASAIGSANAWTNALSQGFSAYQGNRLLDIYQQRANKGLGGL